MTIRGGKAVSNPNFDDFSASLQDLVETNRQSINEQSLKHAQSLDEAPKDMPDGIYRTLSFYLFTQYRFQRASIPVQYILDLLQKIIEMAEYL